MVETLTNKTKGDTMKAWDVHIVNDYGQDVEIDTVFYDSDCSAEYVYDGLVNHDGHDPRITVSCGNEKYPTE